jgi:hypothetical protein
VFFVDEIVIYITNAVGYILLREVFELKHDRCKTPTVLVRPMY